MNKHEMRELKALRMKVHNLPKEAARKLLHDAYWAHGGKTSNPNPFSGTGKRYLNFCDHIEIELQNLAARPFRKADRWWA